MHKIRGKEIRHNISNKMTPEAFFSLISREIDEFYEIFNYFTRQLYCSSTEARDCVVHAYIVSQGNLIA